MQAVVILKLLTAVLLTVHTCRSNVCQVER